MQTEILAVAGQKFNEEGYGRVTMRDIAEACDIAVGNLTYHFHKKRDIVDALMEDAFQETMSTTPMRS